MAQAPATRAGSDINRWLLLVLAAFGLVAVVTVLVTYDYWSPPLRNWLASGAADINDEHDDDHPAHGDSSDSLELSDQARRAIGLQIGEVTLTDFERTISVPGMVVERPGRSRVEITAPLTGIVTKILINAGEAVFPGQELFEMRLTHEELVQLQAELLRTAEELDVIGREVARLEKATESGALAGKTLLDRQYEQQKQEAVLRAQRQALMLHGLSEEQVNGILKSRHLLATLAVHVPSVEGDGMKLDPSRLLQVQELRADLGKHVTAGDALAVLADHTDLLIEGEAFEQDIGAVTKVADDQQAVLATLDIANAPDTQLPG
jgi:cobalt-zinc-cadmium efflux system membrane fusion protein